MKYALVRGIPASFDRCIKPKGDPRPIDVPLARQQHHRYCEILLEHGYTVLFAPPDTYLPDCPFVEDTAVVVGNRALLTRPGAASRRDEVAATGEILRHFFDLTRMDPPATLDGGDVLKVGATLFVGRTDRTNDTGIAVLRDWTGSSRTVIPVDLENALHLKSVVNTLREDTVVISGDGVDPTVFSDYKVLKAPEDEGKRLSFLPLGDHVLLPMDCPETGRLFQKEGFVLIPLDVSEIRKAQAGLTCMSVLFEA